MNSSVCCPKCRRVQYILYGSAKGKKRYKCKNCDCQFTKNIKNGREIRVKVYALMLYLSGLSMNMISKIVGVSRQAVMQWMRNFEAEFHLSKEQGKVFKIELSKIPDFIMKSDKTLNSKKFFVAKLEGCSAFIFANEPPKDAKLKPKQGG